jgi:hypothetical protein
MDLPPLCRRPKRRPKVGATEKRLFWCAALRSAQAFGREETKAQGSFLVLIARLETLAPPTEVGASTEKSNSFFNRFPIKARIKWLVPAYVFACVAPDLCCQQDWIFAAYRIASRIGLTAYVRRISSTI